MDRAGTLPENSYFEELRPSTTESANDIDEGNQVEEEEEQDKIPEYHTDSGAENSEDGTVTVTLVSKETTFLVGTSIRYGRSVTFNKKYLQY